jgi:plasmid segregation protein ParM
MTNLINNAKKKAAVKGDSAERKASSLYAIDLGNGFTKRVFDGSRVITEPSVFAKVPRINGSKRKFYNIDGKFNYFVGQDVFDAHLDPGVAVNDRERYFTDEYKRMLLGFIASDFADFDVIEIPVMVLGVPNTDHEATGPRMEDFYTGKFIVTVNGNHQLTIDVKLCIVLPQPLGTYAYAVENGLVQEWGDNVLVCDAGSGSFDVASITGDVIRRDEGLTLGALDAYNDLRKYLITQHGNHEAITVENMPNLLQNGLSEDGVATVINNDPEVLAILDDNFDKMYKAIQKWKFDFNNHTRILWTGGTSLLHKSRIEAKKKKLFVVLSEAQTANVLGFYAIAKDIDEDGEGNGN